MKGRAHGSEERDLLVDAVFRDLKLFFRQIGDVETRPRAGNHRNGYEVGIDLNRLDILIVGRDISLALGRLRSLLFAGALRAAWRLRGRNITRQNQTENENRGLDEFHVRGRRRSPGPSSGQAKSPQLELAYVAGRTRSILTPSLHSANLAAGSALDSSSSAPSVLIAPLREPGLFQKTHFTQRRGESRKEQRMTGQYRSLWLSP